MKEAGSVDDLVQRFATAEMNGQPIGRTVTAGFTKALGVQLRKPLRTADESKRLALRDAIVGAIAGGYVTAMGVDATNETGVDPQRSPDQIWSFWVPCIYTDYARKATKLHEQDIHGAELVGADFLMNALEVLDLGRKGSAKKVGKLGAAYGRAGLVLRLAQSTLTPAAWITDPPPEFLITYANIWDRDDFPP